eukprot:Opistho-2@19556
MTQDQIYRPIEPTADVEYQLRRESSSLHDVVHASSVEIPEDESDKLGDDKIHFSFRKLWAFAGPGFLMSIAYLDPGNIDSDLQAGAAAGFHLLWVLFWATVLGWILQSLAARLGVVTGKHLAEVCRESLPKGPRIALWLMTELAIIGSDIQEVIGSAIAINILSNNHVPIWAGVLITAFDTFTFLFLENYGLRKLEAVFGILIAAMAVSFGAQYGIAAPNQLDVLKGVVIPSLPSGSITQAVGLIGAVIMPHNIYLHSALVQSRTIDRTNKKKVKEANYYYRIETAIALGIAFVINLFVVSVFADSFYGKDDPNTDFDISNAGDRLAEKFGTYAKYVWAIGLLAAGQSSTMTGTYAGQFVMQGFLNLTIVPWKRVLLTRSVAIVPAIIVATVTQNSSEVLSKMGEWLNILQSVQLPFAVIPVLVATSSTALMGGFRIGRKLESFCWAAAVLVMGTNFFLIEQFASDNLPHAPYVYIVLSLLAIFYVSFIVYLASRSELGIAIRSRLCWRSVANADIDERRPLIADTNSG